MEPVANNTDQLKTCLTEAMDLLDDIKDKLGMFQTQRYYRLKREMELMATNHESHYDSMPDTGKPLIFLS